MTYLQQHRDKVLHVIAGFLASLFISLVSSYLGVGAVVSALIGITASVIAGGTKELYDDRGHGTFDGWDAYWTVVGGVIAQAALLFQHPLQLLLTIISVI